MLVSTQNRAGNQTLKVFQNKAKTVTAELLYEKGRLIESNTLKNYPGIVMPVGIKKVYGEIKEIAKNCNTQKITTTYTQGLREVVRTVADCLVRR